MVAHWAKPGVRVVCVRPSKARAALVAAFGLTDAQVGKIYTIRDVLPDMRHMTDASYVSVGLTFEEIINPIHPVSGFEFCMDIVRFKPLVTRTQSQDIAEHFDIEAILRNPDIAPLDIPMLDEVGQ